MPEAGTIERCGIAELPTGNRAGLLQTRAELARRQLECCQLCEHRCEVNRAAGEFGVCRAGPVARVFRHRVEYGEELELVPSHIFYLSGCDLRCVFCIAEANAFDPERGVPLTSEFFTQGFIGASNRVPVMFNGSAERRPFTWLKYLRSWQHARSLSA